MSLAAASRYARALVDITVDPRNGLDPAQVSENLASFEAALQQDEDFNVILLSPAVASSKKRAVIARLADTAGTPRLVRNFFYVLIDRRRVSLLGDIRRSFQSLLDERLGVARADVASALPLNGAQRDAVAAELSRLTGKQVRCEFTVDPALVGGVAARIGSTIYDGSVRGQLGSLRRQLVAEG